MITRVEVVSPLGGVLDLPLEDVTDGYSVQDVQNLDPVKATLTYNSVANQDDEQEQSQKREKRNIILTVGYEPDFFNTTVRDLRSRLYSYLMPKSEVTLRFYSDDGLEPVEIQGRVESFDSPLFNTPEPKATISIMCAKSDFYGLDVQTVSGSLLVMGNAPAAGVGEFIYPGSTETGILFTLPLTQTTPSLMIENVLPNGRVLQMGIVAPLVAGDIVEINTVPLQKYVRYTRAGATRTMLFGMVPGSDWMTVVPGVNKLNVFAQSSTQFTTWTANYLNKYGGL